MSKVTDEFLAQVVLRISENPPRIEQCISGLTEDQLWFRPNESLSSIGNLILHLCGNIRQYAITSLSETTDIRNRSSEFNAHGNYTKCELLSMLKSTVQEAIQVVETLNEKQLMKTYEVQCYSLSGMGILVHVAEHFSYHTGQIVFLTKFLANKHLKFYDDAKL
ncbi:MAG: putative damage-inducible protein DinB [Flavobacteriales bacterium]|jgi:uncharacterized damage-inducible protein DinB